MCWRVSQLNCSAAVCADCILYASMPLEVVEVGKDDASGEHSVNVWMKIALYIIE